MSCKIIINNNFTLDSFQIKIVGHSGVIYIESKENFIKMFSEDDLDALSLIDNGEIIIHLKVNKAIINQNILMIIPPYKFITFNPMSSEIIDNFYKMSSYNIPLKIAEDIYVNYKQNIVLIKTLESIKNKFVYTLNNERIEELKIQQK